MLERLLTSLGFTPEETRTYLLLLETGPTTVGVLAKKTGTPRPSLYGFLRNLHKKGLVSQSQQEGVQTFAAESPAKLNTIFEQRIEDLEYNRAQFVEVLPDLEKRIPFGLLQPRFQLFEGEHGVQHVLKDMLLYRDIQSYAYWPIKAMVDILSPEFFRYHNKERIKRNIFTQAIWPMGQTVPIKDHPYLGSGTAFKREVRIAPKGAEFSMGYWIYKNKVAFVSSRKESFGFIIESKESVDMLLSQFTIIWELAKPMKMDPKDGELFLRELGRYN